MFFLPIFGIGVVSFVFFRWKEYRKEQIASGMEEALQQKEGVQYGLEVYEEPDEARRDGRQFFLISQEHANPSDLRALGYEIVEEQTGYSLCKSTLEGGQWLISNYATVTGRQSMFYTMLSADGTLVVVDGGWSEDADEVREVVRTLGNHVDIWICSHFHEDHIGAINRILPNPGDMRIDEIWCPNMDMETYLSFAREWDTAGTAETFLSLTSEMDNVKHKRRGDVETCDNITFTFFNAFDTNNALTYDGNNCGFMFRVEGEAERMLFCCDICQEAMSNELISLYGKEVKADYVNMGHHGNWSLTEEFYTCVAPRKAFFDAPDEILKDTTGTYTGPYLVAFMEGLGCEILTFATAPNRVILK